MLDQASKYAKQKSCSEKVKSIWKLYQSLQKCRLMHGSRLEVVGTACSWETGEHIPKKNVKVLRGNLTT